VEKKKDVTEAAPLNDSALPIDVQNSHVQHHNGINSNVKLEDINGNPTTTAEPASTDTAQLM
jgi:hypothetical protein